ncbi:MAG: 2'-deoxycytidine 5'-triphosphate deaminase [Hyphomicrobium sp.]|nr:MAG: 2'-deoxycytidine 5'-triphosphate deaminase [Hyphomicrobium sp.]
MTKPAAKKPRKQSAKQTGKYGERAASGIVPAQAIRALISSGRIKLAEPLLPNQLQPASLDLRLGPVAFRVRASFLPGPGTVIARKLDDFKMHTIDISHSAVLETGCVYIVPLMESLKLVPSLSAVANPKSSTGRLDVFTRVIADGVSAFDQVPEGYQGPLYAEICPQTFPIVVRKGSRLSQIRFRHGQPENGDRALVELQRSQTLVATDHANIQDGIALSVDLSGSPLGLIGYRAKRHTGLVDIDAAASCATADYWEPILSEPSRRLILDPDQFYILASKEAVHVPPTHAAEMVPYNPLVGEFRVHYAGFFDPGFGHVAAGGAGAKAVLEVRSHNVPFILEDGQIVGRLIYERMMEVPEMLYGRDLGSNYQAQGLKLSKHFR